jgi:SAM-dependent methyltransferase
MPTDWEAQYEKKETPWDKGGPCPGLVDFLANESMTGAVLVPGCGVGYDVRALAAGGAEVVGLDVAPSAIRAAEAFPRAGRERYELADLFALPQHLREAFDCVWEHTCFCAIDLARRADYVAAVHGALRPGGRLLAIFYLDPGNASPDEGPPFEVSINELDRLFLPRFTLEREWLPEHAYPGREGREWMRLLRRK